MPFAINMRQYMPIRLDPPPSIYSITRQDRWVVEFDGGTFSGMVNRRGLEYTMTFYIREGEAHRIYNRLDGRSFSIKRYTLLGRLTEDIRIDSCYIISKGTQADTVFEVRFRRTDRPQATGSGKKFVIAGDCVFGPLPGQLSQNFMDCVAVRWAKYDRKWNGRACEINEMRQPLLREAMSGRFR